MTHSSQRTNLINTASHHDDDEEEEEEDVEELRGQDN